MSSLSSSSSRPDLTVGDRCLVGTKRGVIAFAGETKFAAGRWIGVILDTAEGKNDGSVQGDRYFHCQANHGLFVKATMVKPDPTFHAEEKKQRSPSPSAASSQLSVAEGRAASHSRKASSSASVQPRSPNLHPHARAASISTGRGESDSKPQSGLSPRSPRSPRSPSPLPSRAAAQTPQSAALDKKREDLFKLQESRQQLQQQQSAEAAAAAISSSDPTADTISVDHYRLLASDLTKSKATIAVLQQQIAAAPSSSSQGAEVEQLKGEVARLTKLVEVLTLDKAVSEEHEEELGLEMDGLREQLAAVQEEVRQLREAEGRSRDDLMQSLQVTADAKEMLKVMEQNRQLAAALRNLRDVTVSEKEKSKRVQEEMAEEVRLLREVEEEATKLRKRCERLEREVAEYREQLDELSEYQQMVENLTERNIRLQDERKAQQDRIVFLQNLNEASEEVEESHLELEQTLSAELEAKEAEMADLQAKLRYRVMQVEEANRLVRQFRELVRSLEGEVKGLREREVSRSVGERVKGGGGRAGGGKGAGEQSALLRAQLKEMRGRHVREHLAAAEADEYRQRYDFIALYLPQNVSVDDRSIDTMALLHRMKGKTALLQAVLSDYYTGRHVYDKHDDLTLYAYHLLLLLTEVSRIVDFSLHSVRLLSPEQWDAVVSSHRDLISAEGDLDSYISLIEQDSVHEMTSVSNVVHAYQTLCRWLCSRLGMAPASVDSVVETGKEGEKSLPFSVGVLYLMRRYASLPDAVQQREREQEEDIALQRLSQAIESKTMRISPSAPLPLLVDGRYLVYSSQLLAALVEQVGDVMQQVGSARWEGRVREKRAKELEGGLQAEERLIEEKVKEKQRRNDLMESEAAGAEGREAEDEEDEGEHHRLYLQLEDVNGNVQQIAQQIVQTVMSAQLAGKQVQASRREDVMRLVFLAVLRVQRCVTEMAALLSEVRAVTKEERMEKVRMADHTEEERITAELQQLMGQHVLPSDAGLSSSHSSALNLSHEINQLKATMLELTRTLSATEDIPPSSSSSSPAHPFTLHAATTRAQLEASAAIRIQLQELAAKMSEKQREVVGLRTREQEQQSKIAVLQSKLALLSGKVEGVEGMKVELDAAKHELEEATAQLKAAQEEQERLGKENKALRKQVLKMKHAQVKRGEEAASAAKADGASTAAYGRSEDVQLLQQTIRVLRHELVQARGQRAREALQFELELPLYGVGGLPTAGGGRGGGAGGRTAAGGDDAEGDWLRGLRSQMNVVHRSLFDWRVGARIVDVTGEKGREEDERKEKRREDDEKAATHREERPSGSEKRTNLRGGNADYVRRAALLAQLQLAKRKMEADLSSYVERRRTERYRGLFISSPVPNLNPLSAH